jgi:hypothetical protein
MKKQFLIIGIVAILVTVGLSGCTSQTYNESNNNTNTLDDEPVEEEPKNEFNLLMLINHYPAYLVVTIGIESDRGYVQQDFTLSRAGFEGYNMTINLRDEGFDTTGVTSMMVSAYYGPTPLTFYGTKTMNNNNYRGFGIFFEEDGEINEVPYP